MSALSPAVPSLPEHIYLVPTDKNDAGVSCSWCSGSAPAPEQQAGESIAYRRADTVEAPLYERDALLIPVLTWLAQGETGDSSKTLAFTALGIEQSDEMEIDYPRDPGDFRRCVALLQAVPALRDRMGKVAALSPEWAGLVGSWDAIEAQLVEELATSKSVMGTWRMMEKAML